MVNKIALVLTKILSMKNPLHFKSNLFLEAKKKIFFLAFVFCAINISFGQQVIDGAITVNKTIVENPDECNQFDVTLEITGAPPQKPVEVMLVIDVSGSMDDDIPNLPNHSLDYAKVAANNFIDNVFTAANNPTGLNRVGIVSYSTNGTLRMGLSDSSDIATLKSTVNGLSAGGWTNIAEGMNLAAADLNSNAKHDCNSFRSIVVLTDGVATAGTGSCGDGYNQCAIDQAIAAADAAKNYTLNGEDYETKVYSIAMLGGITDGSTTEETARNTMYQVSSDERDYADYLASGPPPSSDYFYETQDASDLSNIYGQIFDQIGWAAKQIDDDTALVTEVVGEGFNIVGQAVASKCVKSIVSKYYRLVFGSSW